MNSWRLISFFAIGVGLYPIVFFLPSASPGFLEGKADVADSTLWWTAFYMHIIGGGVALLTGWIQLWKGFRNKHLKTHRRIGLIYWVAILLVGAPGGLYAAYYAMGGFPAKVGFTLLGVFWFISTLKGLLHIKSRNTQKHEIWMIRSFALTYGAVTLRIYLPLFTAAMGIPFPEAYVTVSWLAWVPNLIVAEWIINNRFGGYKITG